MDERDRSLVAFDPATNTITGRIPFELVGAYEVRLDGREIYLSDRASHSVVVVSTATMRVVARILVGSDPVGFAFTPDSRRVYVSVHFDSVLTVIDTSTYGIVKVIDMVDMPHVPVMSPDGSRVYVGTDHSGVVSRKVAVVSTATNTVRKRIQLRRRTPPPTGWPSPPMAGSYWSTPAR